MSVVPLTVNGRELIHYVFQYYRTVPFDALLGGGTSSLRCTVVENTVH